MKTTIFGISNKGEKMEKKLILIGLLTLLSISFVFALPSGPNSAITPVSSSRYTAATGKTTSAIAGNVTEINFNATTITQTWQGYFGSVTGTIVLGNSNNKTLYDWNLASPQGEIYATRYASTPSWAGIRCANATEIGAEHTFSGATATAVDRLANTFIASTAFTTFYVGATSIASGASCYAANMYNNTGAQTAKFSEVILSDTTNIIYTALLEQNAMGFDGSTYDFEMIVAENGHLTDTSTTTYYFYLELE